MHCFQSCDGKNSDQASLCLLHCWTSAWYLRRTWKFPVLNKPYKVMSEFLYAKYHTIAMSIDIIYW